MNYNLIIKWRRAVFKDFETKTYQNMLYRYIDMQSVFYKVLLCNLLRLSETIINKVGNLNMNYRMILKLRGKQCAFYVKQCYENLHWNIQVYVLYYINFHLQQIKQTRICKFEETQKEH